MSNVFYSKDLHIKGVIYLLYEQALRLTVKIYMYTLEGSNNFYGECSDWLLSFTHKRGHYVFRLNVNIYLFS